MEYLPTFGWKKNDGKLVGKYTSPMDPSWVFTSYSFTHQLYPPCRRTGPNLPKKRRRRSCAPGATAGGGFNPFEKYARHIASSPQVRQNMFR